MKEKLTHNLGMKILSLAIAFVIWVVIINIDDPVITKTFSQISVEKENEDAINSLNKVYEVITGDVVNITVKGKRSVVDSLRSSDFKATADFNKLSSVYSVPIKPSITKNIEDEVELSLGKVDTLIVKLEDIDEKQFQVSVVEQGTVEDGYCIGAIKVKPNLIKVSGAKSQISRIDQVRVDLDVSNASEAIVKILEPKVYDDNGYLIDSSNMKFSSAKIKVTASLLPTKTVPLYIKTTGDQNSEYECVSMDYEPKTITIAGKQSDLDAINSINKKITITNAKDNIEEEINLEDDLPEGIQLVNQGQTAMVTVKLEKLIVGSFTIQTSDIDFKNLPTDLDFRYTNQSSITVMVKGNSDTINKMSKTDLNPYIDLSNLKKGKHIVKIQFDLDDGVTIVNSPMVGVELDKVEVLKKQKTVTDTNKSSNDTNVNDTNQSSDSNDLSDENSKLDNSPTPTASVE